MAHAPHLVAGGGHASLLGSSLGGYQVQALIGRGAMGTVYLARDTALNRPVALKVLLGSLARNPSMVRSFYREAQAAAPLRHPCVVRIYSAGVEAGTPYIAMEYVPGEPLDRFLRRTDKVGWQTALYIGAQLAKALECAHAAGVIHRDVKPANILLDLQGRVRLTDFGIARVATLDAQGGAARNVVGTPTYMSPEQCDAAELTPATDLYSLGVVLYQLLAGHPPFRAESPHALAKQILTDDAPRLNRLLPEIPDDVARLVAHLLQKEPGARPRSAAHVARTIERIQAENGGKSAVPEALSTFVREQAVESSLRLMTPPPPRSGKTAKASPRSETTAWRMAVPVLVTAGLALMVVFGWIFATMGHGSNRATPAPEFTACRFQENADGSVFASAVLDGFVFHELRWSRQGLIVVEARGREGTLLDGATGLLALSPETRQCVSVHAPHAPFATEPEQLTPAPLNYRIPSEDGGAFGNAVLMTRRITDASAPTAQTEWFTQPVTDALPRALPVYRDETAKAGDRLHAIALHPDGKHFCITVQDSGGDRFLVERRAGSRSNDSPMGPAITSAMRVLVPGSVQYTPDGRAIAYMRETGPAVRELWITPREPGSAAVLLAVGDLNSSYAFSPDGSRVLLSVRNSDAAEPELRLVDTATGSVLGRPARGSAGPEAWLPSGDGFIIAQGSPRQAWLIPTADSHDAQPVTQLEYGIRGNPAVSPDGRWIAVIAERRSDQSVVFVPVGGRSTILAQAALQ